jgi:hypothetical protein
MPQLFLMEAPPFMAYPRLLNQLISFTIAGLVHGIAAGATAVDLESVGAAVVVAGTVADAANHDQNLPQDMTLNGNAGGQRGLISHLWVELHLRSLSFLERYK